MSRRTPKDVEDEFKRQIRNPSPPGPVGVGARVQVVGFPSIHGEIEAEDPHNSDLLRVRLSTGGMATFHRSELEHRTVTTMPIDCQCGAEASGIGGHSRWCPKFEGEN